MRPLSTVAVIAGVLAAAPCASAQDSLQNGSNASRASTQVAGDLAASGIQTVSAAAVLPASGLAAGSAVAGSVVTTAGAGLTHSAVGASQAASAAASVAAGPLPLTREVIVAAQPAPRVPYDAQTGGVTAQGPRQ